MKTKTLLISAIALCAICIFPNIGNCQIISTIAGTGSSNYCCDGGPATAAELWNVTGVFADATGNVYIVDDENFRIRMINTSGNINTIAGNGTGWYGGDGGQATAAELNYPYGIFVNSSGNIYIADVDNNRIRMVTSSGVISTVAGNGIASYSGDGGAATAAELNSPSGVAVDASGNIYIADDPNQRIRMVNTTGVISTVAGNGTAGYSGDGGQATNAELDAPWGLTVDGSGNIYIADYSNNRIRMVNSSGIITTVVGTGVGGFSGDGGQATAAQIKGPMGVFIDASGNIYFPDWSNERIRMVNSAGIITTVAGNGTLGFSGDGGQATAAELNKPRSVFVNASGNIYIADEYNNRVRMVKSTLGVNEMASQKINVTLYPNPNNGQFTFQVDKGKNLGDNTVEVYNIIGEKIYTKSITSSETEINLTNQPKGLYLYRVISDNGNAGSSGKFMIQ